MSKLHRTTANQSPLVNITAINQWPAMQFMQPWEHVPGVFFFVKDRQGRFLRANRALLDRLGMQDEAEIVGTTDHDRYPPHLADRLVAGDRQVMTSGQPLLDHADILYDESGGFMWFRSHKYPLRDRRGRIVGVFGITTAHRGGARHSLGNATVDRSLKIIDQQGADGSLRIAALARATGVSVRTLNRNFQQVMGLSAQEFLLHSRIQATAAALRETSTALAEIAMQHGFCDQSAFTRQFRQRLGMTPLAYRTRYRHGHPPGAR
ncbi:helix-turn-helix domain-containing protein [Prosthecobacter sp.]|uniref:helix-turn-helix transcriptional regulator n=1 Tax=Prosthecobacter sp. TaxID=1965333 RepID=UPI0024897088|nr:helix-turn-helix domain-containing protein [Prosthecobacter sp.]MDI1315642.1 helix-turn-helix domain-containing protein [Prosthecobacter sp.]